MKPVVDLVARGDEGQTHERSLPSGWQLRAAARMAQEKNETARDSRRARARLVGETGKRPLTETPHS